MYKEWTCLCYTRDEPTVDIIVLSKHRNAENNKLMSRNIFWLSWVYNKDFIVSQNISQTKPP